MKQSVGGLMKILICFIFLLCCVSLKAQEHVDVTVQDANQLKPGARQKEISDWIKSQAIQSAVSSALQQPSPQNVAPQSPQNAPAPAPSTQNTKVLTSPDQVMRLVYIYSSMFDPLLKKHPELKDEMDALYVQNDDQATQLASNKSTPVEEQRGLKVFILHSIVSYKMIEKHPELKPEFDAMYVQYDDQYAQEMSKTK